MPVPCTFSCGELRFSGFGASSPPAGDGLGQLGRPRHGGRLDVHMGQGAVQPTGQPPVGPAEEVHEGRYEHGPDDEGVEQDGGGKADPHLLDDPGAPEDEAGEDEDHDQGGGGDDAAGLGLAPLDGEGIVAGLRTHSSCIRDTRKTS